MKLTFCTVYILPLVFPTLSQAQEASVAPTDTVGYIKGGYGKFRDTFYMGNLIKIDGTQLTGVYLPATLMGYGTQIDYFLTPPGQPKRAKRYTLKIKKVQSMTVHRRYYENILSKGKPSKVLGVRMLTGPVELLTYAQPGVVPVPIPGAAVLLVNAYTNNRWYVRRNGELKEVSRLNFATEMSQYLADYPELAQKVIVGEKNYRYRNTLSIITEYNQHATAASK
ncbi:hypothetical protein SAMN00120144_1090 [Hymenobacter roseosalivarius DSM 11622]|uniref:Uncharacterized protein n=1 Tax=Hymenobacter roseosalivarius DSM 11622 TaxID=645990 RepID=A0A1W1VZV8_9BACT|nr:hypothetical protein [Hymenobacter roseosalivarius]SMB98404.1 hypothetical protein SAMN00120144_1090 [Hymenobacter roseosalivarius DSM 11622]